jgi:hypothetical protein
VHREARLFLLLAHRGAPAAALGALAAAQNKGHGDAVPHAELRHAGPDLGDDAAELVARGEREAVVGDVRIWGEWFEGAGGF